MGDPVASCLGERWLRQRHTGGNESERKLRARRQQADKSDETLGLIRATRVAEVEQSPTEMDKSS